jgi:hypothetical protein
MKKRIWLCLPPFLFSLLDQGFTLWNQSEQYWRGHYAVALEANPVSYQFLSKHPLIYAVGVLFWILLFLLLIISLPRRLAMILSVAITFGHTWGLVSWIMQCSVMPGMAGCGSYSSVYGYWICLALIFVAAVLLVLAWEKLGYPLRN